MDKEEYENEFDSDEEYDDTEYEGDNTIWKVLVRAWSNEKEWCDTTMAMQLPNGVLIRTQYTTDDGMGDAEALQFIPNVHLEQDHEDRWVIK